MIVTIKPRGCSIVGVLPKNKPINGEMTLDLNEREINYCMDKADVFDENGVLLTSKVIEKYDGASHTITKSSTTDKLNQQVELFDQEPIEPPYEPLPLVSNIVLCINPVEYTDPSESGRNTVFIEYDPKNDGNINNSLYGIISAKGRDATFQMCNPNTFVLGKKFGSKFADFVADGKMEWAIEVIPSNPSVENVTLSVQLKRKDTNKVVASDELVMHINKK